MRIYEIEDGESVCVDEVGTALISIDTIPEQPDKRWNESHPNKRRLVIRTHRYHVELAGPEVREFITKLELTAGRANIQPDQLNPTDR